jgi:hypothetical protein
VLYEAYSRNEPSPLPELKIQYADYAVWQKSWLQGERLERHLLFGSGIWPARLWYWNCPLTNQDHHLKLSGGADVSLKFSQRVDARPQRFVPARRRHPLHGLDGYLSTFSFTVLWP